MSNGKNDLLWKYLGFATQCFMVIAAGLFAGLKLDKWLKFSTPIAVWVLPLLLIIVMIVKVVKDTSAKK